MTIKQQALEEILKLISKHKLERKVLYRMHYKVYSTTPEGRKKNAERVRKYRQNLKK